jgi:nucleotide-binding universal stress UspA family protein
MLNNILAPLDGSLAAEAGLHWALHAARRCQAAIDLFTVVDAEVSDADGHMMRAEEYLRTRRNDIAAGGLTVNLEVVTGPPPERIRERAAAAELTVMTYGTSRWLFGGALDLMLRNMIRPLVVVRAPSGQPGRESDTRKVLVPLDTAAYSRHALPEAQQLAKALGASIVLCHVIAPVGPYLDPTDAPPGVRRIIEELMEKAHFFLSGIAREVEREGITVETIVTMGEPPRQIVRVAERSQAGVVAMATRGTHSLSRIMGSVAYGVLQFGHLPSLLVRPTDTS